MCNSDRRHFLAMSLLTVGAVSIGGVALAQEPAPKKIYVCPPCGCAADGKEFAEPGNCPECGMPLVEKKPEPAKPPGGEQGAQGGGGLMAKQTRAAPRSAWTGKRSDAPQPSGGFLS